MHEHVHSLDRSLSAAVNRLPVILTPLMQFATLIGQPFVIVPVALLVGVYAYDKGKQGAALAVILAMVAMVGNSLLKMLFQRERPDTLYVQNMLIKSYSFPSGHAFGSAVFYGLVGYLLFKYAPHPWGAIGVVASAVLIFLIGVSRVYLGAHFPSDVLIGWILGLVSLAIIIQVCKP